jgi:outer membrane protein TolC
MTRKKCLVLVLAALGAGTGCKIYHDLPLDRRAKEATLKAPDLAQVRVEALRLKHPLLQPLDLDPKGSFSPEQAAVLAVLLNPDLKAVRDQRALAEAQLLDAGLLPDPVLAYAQDTPVGGDAPGLATAHSFQVGMDLTALLTRGLRRRAAKAEQASVDLEVAWQEWQVAQAAKLAVYRLATLAPQAEAAKATVAVLAEDLQVLEQAATSGDALQGEVATARAALDSGRRDALAVGLELVRNREALNALLGLPPRTQVALGIPLREGAWEGLPSEGELASGLDRRLDLVALEKGYESEDARVRLAIWSQFPSIGIALSRARDTSNVVTRGAGVSVSLPLFNRGQGLVAVANATRRQLYDQFLARLHQSRSDLAQALSDLEATRAQIASAAAALPGLEAQARAADEAFRAGGLDLLTRNQARLVALSQASALAALRRSLDELGVALELIAGRTLSYPSKETSR